MIKNKIFLLVLIGSFVNLVSAQEKTEFSVSRSITIPQVGIKNNLLYDLTSTINMGIEIGLSDYLTLDLSGSYNPFEFSSNKKIKHLLVQPELRYWVYEPFNGHFLGAHAIYSQFNVGNVSLPLDIYPNLKNYRYEGFGYGLGLSYGYQWILKGRWNLEFSLGLGYIYLDYERYQCQSCGDKLGEGNKNYFGPTKIGLSLIYLLK